MANNYIGPPPGFESNVNPTGTTIRTRLRCSSGRHVWGSAEDAARCCRGWEIIWVPMELKNRGRVSLHWERRLVPEAEAKCLGQMRFRMPGEILNICSDRAFDELCSMTGARPPEKFQKSMTIAGKTLHRCHGGGHYLFTAQDAERCCNGWVQVRRVRPLSATARSLGFDYELVRVGDSARLAYLRRLEEASYRLLTMDSATDSSID